MRGLEALDGSAEILDRRRLRLRLGSARNGGIGRARDALPLRGVSGRARRDLGLEIGERGEQLLAGGGRQVGGVGERGFDLGNAILNHKGSLGDARVIGSPWS